MIFSGKKPLTLKNPKDPKNPKDLKTLKTLRTLKDPKDPKDPKKTLKELPFWSQHECRPLKIDDFIHHLHLTRLHLLATFSHVREI